MGPLAMRYAPCRQEKRRETMQYPHACLSPQPAVIKQMRLRSISPMARRHEQGRAWRPGVGNLKFSYMLRLVSSRILVAIPNESRRLFVCILTCFPVPGDDPASCVCFSSVSVDTSPTHALSVVYTHACVQCEQIACPNL